MQAEICNEMLLSALDVTGKSKLSVSHSAKTSSPTLVGSDSELTLIEPAGGSELGPTRPIEAMANMHALALPKTVSHNLSQSYRVNQPTALLLPLAVNKNWIDAANWANSWDSPTVDAGERHVINVCTT
eukprot:165743-Rhodomonas_salina.4